MGGLIAVLVLGWGIGLVVMVMVAAGSIAEAKGRGKGNWQLLALMYGILAVITVYLMPPLTTTLVASRSVAAPAPSTPATRR